MARSKKQTSRTSTTRRNGSSTEDSRCGEREIGRRVRTGDGDSATQLLPFSISSPKRKSDEAKIGGKALKEKGNAYFKRGDFVKAVDAYTEALTVCEPRNFELLQLRRRILCNRSAASLRVARNSSPDQEQMIAATRAAFEDADAVLVAGHSPFDLKSKALLRKAEAQVAYWRIKANVDDIFLTDTSLPTPLRVYELETTRDRTSSIANSSLLALRRELCLAIVHPDFTHVLRLRAGQILASMYPPAPEDRDQTYLDARHLIIKHHDIDITRQLLPEEEEEEEEEENCCGGDSSTAALPDCFSDGEHDDDDDQDTVVEDPPREDDEEILPAAPAAAAAATAAHRPCAPTVEKKSQRCEIRSGNLR